MMYLGFKVPHQPILAFKALKLASAEVQRSISALNLELKQTANICQYLLSFACFSPCPGTAQKIYADGSRPPKSVGFPCVFARKHPQPHKMTLEEKDDSRGSNLKNDTNPCTLSHRKAPFFLKQYKHVHINIYIYIYICTPFHLNQTTLQPLLNPNPKPKSTQTPNPPGSHRKPTLNQP